MWGFYFLGLPPSVKRDSALEIANTKLHKAKSLKHWQRHLAAAQAWFMVGRIRRWWCKTAHQGSLGVCQEKPPNWHAHKFYSAHYTQTYTQKKQRQTHRQIRIFQCAPTLKHESLHQAYSCLLQFTNIKKSVQSQQLMAESCQRRDFRLQHCYLLQFTFSLFSVLVF